MTARIAADQRPRAVAHKRPHGTRAVSVDGDIVGATWQQPDGRWAVSLGHGVERRRHRTMRAAMDWIVDHRADAWRPGMPVRCR